VLQSSAAVWIDAYVQRPMRPKVAAMKIAIRTFRPEDVDLLAAAFRTWPKPRELFVDYANRVAAGSLELLLAELN
jgi:hypothetical protein